MSGDGDAAAAAAAAGHTSKHCGVREEGRGAAESTFSAVTVSPPRLDARLICPLRESTSPSRRSVVVSEKTQQHGCWHNNKGQPDLPSAPYVTLSRLEMRWWWWRGGGVARWGCYAILPPPLPMSGCKSARPPLTWTHRSEADITLEPVADKERRDNCTGRSPFKGASSSSTSTKTGSNRQSDVPSSHCWRRWSVWSDDSLRSESERCNARSYQHRSRVVKISVNNDWQSNNKNTLQNKITAFALIQ